MRVWRGPVVILCGLWVGLSAMPAASPAQDTLHVYGPGGPLPAIHEAARAYGTANGLTVRVTGGPADEWMSRARRDAHLIYSGSEHMMTDLVRQLDGRIEESTIVPLYLRPAAILVRPGNPKRIERFEDLLAPGVGVLVVEGAGQTGLWEDVAGRTGDIATVRALRANIRTFAASSGEARETWNADPTLDAWLIWNIWQVANPEIADMVPLDERWAIYRDCGVALTRRGLESPHAARFVEFLRSADGARIFGRWGWITGPTI